MPHLLLDSRSSAKEANQPPTPAAAALRHRNNFDFIRLAAASLVVCGHVYAMTGNEVQNAFVKTYTGLFPAGHVGLFTFFSLSGYLIAQSAESSASAVNFLWKRLLRIVPGLAVVLLVSVLVVGPLVTSLPLRAYFSDPDTWRYLLNLKLFPYVRESVPGAFENQPSPHMNGSLWTLAYEVTFYLATLAAFSLGLFRRRWLLLAGWLALWVSALYWYPHAESNLRVPGLHLRATFVLNFGLYFGAGMLAYLYRDRLPYRWPLAVLAAVLWLGLFQVPAITSRVPPVVFFWLRFLVLPYLVFYLAFLPGRLNRFGRRGDFSYGVYIYAYPVQQTLIWALGVQTPMWALVALCFACTLPLAWLSWTFVEKPALRLKKWVNG